MRTSYDNWINGNGCCNAHNFITISGNCKTHDDACSCENMLLEISKLWTNDEILQEEIDSLSGDVETKLDISAYTPTDLSDYYTKEQVDALIPDVPSLSGYATEQWVLDKHYISGVDLSDYALKSDIPSIITLEQTVINLQQQINSLIASISGCCGSSGETQYRWITEVGENDYWCSGTTKMSMEKQQSSTDGINWIDTGSERNGSTVLEENCADCGYLGGSRIQCSYSSSTAPTIIASVCSSNIERVSIAKMATPTTYNNCITSVQSALAWDNTITTDRVTTTIEDGEYADTDMLGAGLSSEVTAIGDSAFSGNTSLSALSIGNYSRLDPTNPNPNSNISSIGNYAFKGCTGMKNIQLIHSNHVPTLGTGAFDGCTSLEHIYVKSEMANAFKQASGWSDYSSIITGI